MRFVDIMKGMNHYGLWDVELIWHPLSTTYQICHYDFEHSLRIHSLRPTWPCLIIKFVANWAKFLEPSDYKTVINCTFTFHTANVFSCFCSVMAQFEHVNHEFPNYSTRSSVQNEAMHNMSAYQLLQYYQSQQVLSTALVTWYTCCKLAHTYQNIAKLLTHLSITQNESTVIKIIVIYIKCLND